MRLNGQHTVIARIRRGKYVRIPPEWRGRVTDRQTIRKRPSKRHQVREPTVQEQRVAPDLVAAESAGRLIP